MAVFRSQHMRKMEKPGQKNLVATLAPVPLDATALYEPNRINTELFMSRPTASERQSQIASNHQKAEPAHE